MNKLFPIMTSITDSMRADSARTIERAFFNDSDFGGFRRREVYAWIHAAGRGAKKVF